MARTTEPISAILAAVRSVTALDWTKPKAERRQTLIAAAHAVKEAGAIARGLGVALKTQDRGKADIYATAARVSTGTSTILREIAIGSMYQMDLVAKRHTSWAEKLRGAISGKQRALLAAEVQRATEALASVVEDLPLIVEAQAEALKRERWSSGRLGAPDPTMDLAEAEPERYGTAWSYVPFFPPNYGCSVCGAPQGTPHSRPAHRRSQGEAVA